MRITTLSFNVKTEEQEDTNFLVINPEHIVSIHSNYKEEKTTFEISICLSNGKTYTLVFENNILNSELEFEIAKAVENKEYNEDNFFEMYIPTAEMMIESNRAKQPSD